MRNADPTVTSGFGHEWSTFKQGTDALEVVERERKIIRSTNERLARLGREIQSES